MRLRAWAARLTSMALPDSIDVPMPPPDGGAMPKLLPSASNNSSGQQAPPGLQQLRPTSSHRPPGLQLLRAASSSHPPGLQQLELVAASSHHPLGLRTASSPRRPGLQQLGAASSHHPPRTPTTLGASSSPRPGLNSGPHTNNTAHDNSPHAGATGETKHANVTTHDCQQSATVLPQEEVDHVLQKLRELGLGEDMNTEEYFDCVHQLTYVPPPVDTSLKLDDSQFPALYERHAIYRMKAYKLSQGLDKEDLENVEWKKDFPPDLLRKEAYYLHFEKHGTLDWSFREEYCMLADLDDYQRLVPHNHYTLEGGFEYERWEEYQKLFNGYEIEQEYANFCKTLSVKFKWLEDYLHVKAPLWGMIRSRAAFQAIRIATSFSKITLALVYKAFHEYVQSIAVDFHRYKELDGVYFEIWKRVTKQKMSFRDALDEVCRLNRFPQRQLEMKYALNHNFSLSIMEDQFRTCTANVIEEVAEDTVQELILDAIKKLKGRPKYYQQYIEKKLKIAGDIGLIPKASETLG